MIEFLIEHYSLYATIYTIVCLLAYFIYGLILINVKKNRLIVGIIATLILVVVLVVLIKFNTFIQIKHENLFRINYETIF
jgi:hypothetical protein